VSHRIVITGAGGQVGRFLARSAARQDRDVVAFTSAEWDITDPAAARRVAEGGHLDGAVVVNCAAYTNVDAAEADEARAYAVNATGAGHVAQACARVGAQLIHISTDYVYSGDFGAAAPRPYEPGDPTGPHSVYGRSKLAGEDAVLEVLPGATVVRTAWVYTGSSGTDFAAVMARKARAGEPVDVVDDQTGSPTYVGDLVGALLRIADAGVSAPVVHAANTGGASRFDQARAVYAAVGADLNLVRPVGSAAHPRPAPRPGYSVLGARLSQAAGLPPLRPWADALAHALSGS
jgi:dTDP-4-dehydrorhamnose reductase